MQPEKQIISTCNVLNYIFKFKLYNLFLAAKAFRSGDPQRSKSFNYYIQTSVEGYLRQL